SCSFFHFYYFSVLCFLFFFFFFSSRRRHTRWPRDWSSDVCSSDLLESSPAVACAEAVTGNLKYDQVTASAQATAGLLSRQDLGLADGEELLVAGSTHPGEEEAVLDC